MDSSGDTEDNIQHLKQERHISGDLKNGCEVSSDKIPYNLENNAALYEILQNQKSPYTRGFRIFMKV